MAHDLHAPPSLFDWPQRRRIEAVAVKRRRLAERIGTLPPQAHRRLLLEARLRDLTLEQMRLEMRTVGDAKPR